MNNLHFTYKAKLIYLTALKVAPVKLNKIGFFMALYYSLPVYRDTYKLVLLIFRITQSFAREYKYTLGQDMKRDAMQLIRSIYRANKATTGKQGYLEEFLDDFELLKLEVRLCVDMKLLSLKRQSEISLLMDSIGKQITGWRNASTVKPESLASGR